MSKLLRANCVRLFKNKIFYIGIFVQIFLTVFLITRLRNGFVIDGTLFSGSYASMLISAVFVPLFIGTEYSDQTIRNKIISGHTRFDIYAANYISAALGTFIICITPLMTAFIMALPFGGHFGSSPAEFALYFTVLTAANAAMCGIYLILSMLVTSKANNVFITLQIWFYSSFATAYIEDLLKQPQIPDGALRTILNFACSIIPIGQILHLGSDECRNAGLLPVYSLLVIVAVTGLGLIIFKRKDLK